MLVPSPHLSPQNQMSAPDLPTMLIGVMGVTGSGKSTFIRTGTGNKDVLIGHTLEACTQKVTAYTFTANGYNIVLIDTPGFDDTYRSDTEVLLDLAKWLEVTYRHKAKLTGMIYLHRISDVRMGGSAMRNIMMFRKLCGQRPMENVVIASTFWEKVTEQQGLDNEDQLRAKDDFWGDMIEHGAQVRTFGGTRDSALDILMCFADKAAVTLDIQRELVDEDKQLRDTAAGDVLTRELNEMEKKYKGMIEQVERDTRTALAEKDVETQRILQIERERMEKKLDRVHHEQEMLRAERREEMRRIQVESDHQFRKIKVEYENKLEREREEAERRREEDKMAFREEVRGLRAEANGMNERLREQMREVEMESLALRAAAAGQERRQNDASPELLVNGLVAAGSLAVRLLELINEM